MWSNGIIDDHSACCDECREVWDDTGRVTRTGEASTSSLQQQQLSQCAAAVTSVPHHLWHSSSQSQQCGSSLKPAFVQQPTTSAVFVPVPSSLPSSASGQADSGAGAFAQFRQLVESCNLPEQVASQLMNWLSQELAAIPHTLCLPSQQPCTHTDSIYISSAGNDGGTSEVHSSEVYCTSNKYGALAPASAQIPSTLCSQQTSLACTAPASTDRALSTQLPTSQQNAGGEMWPPSVDQLCLMTRIQQLQQMYLESAANVLQSLYVLQQQIVPASSTTVDTTPSTTSAAAGALDNAMHSQSSHLIPHSGWRFLMLPVRLFYWWCLLQDVQCSYMCISMILSTLLVCLP